MVTRNESGYYQPRDIGRPREGEPTPQNIWIFAGQGTFAKGTGKGLFESEPSFRTIYRIANQIAGYSISEVSFEDPWNELSTTEKA